MSLLRYLYPYLNCYQTILLSPLSILLNNLGISDNTSVVVYDDTFGALTSRVAWSFKFVGHKNVSLLEVTFSGWKNLGLDIEKKCNIV